MKLSIFLLSFIISYTLSCCALGQSLCQCQRDCWACTGCACGSGDLLPVNTLSEIRTTTVQRQILSKRVYACPGTNCVHFTQPYTPSRFSNHKCKCGKYVFTPLPSFILSACIETYKLNNRFELNNETATYCKIKTMVNSPLLNSIYYDYAIEKDVWPLKNMTKSAGLEVYVKSYYEEVKNVCNEIC